MKTVQLNSRYRNKCYCYSSRSEVIILFSFTQTSACVVVGDRGYFVDSSNDAIEVKKNCNKLSSVTALLLNTTARTEYSLKLFLSIFNLLNEHYHFNDAKLWLGRSLTRAVPAQSFKISRLSGNGFWLVYEDLSIDFGKTNFQLNRDMACKLGCGLFLSSQF